MRDLLDIAKSDELIGQQPKRPVLSPGGWRRASQRQQMSLSFPVQFACSPAGGSAAMQSCVQALFDKALADTMNGLTTDIEGFFDSLISPGWTMWAAIGFEQDLGMGTHASGCGASVDQFTKICAFISSQGYNVLSGHGSGTSKRQMLKQSVVRFYPIHDYLPNSL